MQPVSYGDPSLTIMDAFDRFESGDSNQPLGQDDPGLETPPEAPAVNEPVVVAKEDAADDGDIEEGFFKGGDPDPVVAAAKPADGKELDADAFDAETAKLVEGMSKEAKPGEPGAKSQYDKFKELREELKLVKAKTVTPEVEQKLAKLEEREIVIQQLNERIATMSMEDAQRQLLNSPEYDEQCAKPASRIFGKAEILAKTYEGDVEIIKGVLLEGDPKKRAELIKTNLEALEPADKIKVELWADEFDTLRALRSEMLATAESKVSLFEQRRLESQQRELAEHKQTVESLTTSLFEKYLPIIPGLADDQGKPTQAYKELKAQVSNIDFTKARPQDLAFAGFAGTVVQHLNKQVRQLMRKLATYEKGDVDASRADPGLGSGSQAQHGKPRAKNLVELADEMLG